MKPDWDKLGDAHADSKTVVIGDVDCTTDENKALCQQYGVQGYPTIKYFTSASAPTGDKYEGGRDYASLAKFVEDNLGPQCSMDARDLCSEEQNKTIDEYLAMPLEDINAKIEAKETAIKEAGETLDNLLKSLQKQFEDGKAAKEAAIEEATPGLSTLRMVAKHHAAKETKDEL